jgi:hypothetical protein
MGKKKQQEQEAARSLAIATRGIRTAGDFANMMAAVMTDLATGRLTAQVANAMANVGGKLLKVSEMQQKYGTQGDGPHRELELASDPLAEHGLTALPAPKKGRAA